MFNSNHRQFKSVPNPYLLPDISDLQKGIVFAKGAVGRSVRIKGLVAAQNRNVYYPYRIIRTLTNNNTVLHEVEYIGGTVVVNLNELFWNNLAHVNFIPDFIKAHVRALKVPAKAARPMADGYG